MISLLKEARKDFNLFKEDRRKYAEKVNLISREFNLRGESKFKSGFLPTYVVGNIENSNRKYLLFGINPGFSQRNNIREEKFKGKSWKHYLRFSKYFFRWSEVEGITYRYYRQIGKILGRLDGEKISDNDKLLDYCHRNVVAVELIPYHSKSFRLPKHLSIKQAENLRKRLEHGLALAKDIRAKLAIFNGAPSERLIRDLYPNLLGRYRLVKKTKIYFFRVEKVDCVLFNKFLTQPAFGLTNRDFEVTIPLKIKRAMNKSRRVLSQPKD